MSQSLCTDDIHQEVFVRYICKQPKFESEEHEKAWFLRVTINLSKNWWKTAWRQKVVSMSELADAGEGRETHEGMGDGFTEKAAENEMLIETVKQLPKKYRIVIHLFYFEELSIEEISNVLQLKQSTVRTHLTRARQRLQNLWKEDS